MVQQLLAILPALVCSGIFFRLYAAHDFREIDRRLLRNRYENAPAPDLSHTGRHAVRVAFCLTLALAVGRLTVLTLPAFGAVCGLGYLIFDPTLNKDRGLSWSYSGSGGNKWDAFWQKLTGRTEQAGRWSAYVETVLLLACLTWYVLAALGR